MPARSRSSIPRDAGGCGSPVVPSIRERPARVERDPSAKLDDILRVSGIVRRRSHRALDDADALLTLLAGQNESSGRTYLGEVMLRPPLKAGPTSGTVPGRPQKPLSEEDMDGACWGAWRDPRDPP